MIGKTIGNYRIVEKIGRGATGTVFKALDETLGREVAIKLLHPDLAETDVMKRFQTEVKALANLNHPEIATIHDVQMTGDGVLLVTELVHGESLDALLKRVGPLAPERAALLAAQILSALGHAHDVQVVHRDLKPSNVMVTEFGGVKLLDFAMAPVAGASQMTAAAFAIGTPAYMAPERILGNEVDIRADIYSVGVIFYRLLTDKVPFEAPTPTEMVQKQLGEPPTPLRSYGPNLPQWCQDIVTRALAKPPGDRYQTAAEFRAALLQAGAASSSETTGFHQAASHARSPGDGPTIAAPVPVLRASTAGAQAASAAQPGPVTDAKAATFPTDIPAKAAAEAEDPTGPTAAPQPDLDATFVASTPALAAEVVQFVASAAAAPAVAPLAPVPQADYWGTEATIVGSRLADFSDGAAPTLQLPRTATPPFAKGAEPTMLVPAATAPTVAAPMEALAPTVIGPVASAPTGTLVMPRKQFAVAGGVLGGLALVAVVLAVVVVRRSATVVQQPAAAVAPATVVAPPSASTSPSAPAPTALPPESVVAVTPPPSTAATAPPPPVEISEPAIRTAPADALGSGGARGGSRAARGATPTAPVAVPPANPNLANITNSTPFKFDAKAVVIDGEKRRERDAHILVADGSVTVRQNDDKVIYALPISALTSLTYSSSKQPLWNSPSGPAEAMRVDSGAFGFLKGGRNWLGFQTPDALMILRMDDEIVGRVIAGLQQRTGLPVTRLIEPKE